MIFSVEAIIHFLESHFIILFKISVMNTFDMDSEATAQIIVVQ